MRTVPFWAVFIMWGLGAVLGFVNGGSGIGGLIGPFLAGYLYDVTGNYQLAFAVAAVAIAGAAVAAWIAGPRKARAVWQTPTS
jgi:cyanate permease